MADRLTLDATLRDGTGKGAARAARREGLVPGVIYGGGDEPTPINVKFNELLKHLKAGRFTTQLVDLVINGEKNRVICRDVQRDVVKDLPTHIDFLRLSRTSRIKLFIPVRFEGQEESPGIKGGGTLTVVRSEVELIVRADNIPEELVADISELDVGDSLHIGGMDLPEGSSLVITDRDFAICNVSAPSSLRSEGGDDEDGEAAEGAEGGDAEAEAPAEE